MSATATMPLLKQRLQEALEKRDRSVMVVVGSGVSIAATGNAPAASWGGLLKLGVSRCEQVAANRRVQRFDSAGVLAKLGSSQVADWIDAATAVEKGLGGTKGDKYKSWLEESIGALVPTQPDILDALGRLGAPLATTNYDGLLEHALGLQAMTWRNHALVDQLLEGSYPGEAVLHLHGHFKDPQSVVLGARSYEKLLADKRARETVKRLLQSRDLVFVGMGGGLDDPNFGALIDWAVDVGLPESRNHYLLLRAAETHTWYPKLLLGSRIHVLSYGPNYTNLVPFLRSLVGTGVPSVSTIPTLGTAPSVRTAPSWLDAAVRGTVPITRSLVRRAFFETLRSDADGNAFCLDHYPDTHAQFSDGMNRQQKVSLLMEREEPEAIFAKLREYRSPAPSSASPRPSAGQQAARRTLWRALLRLDRIKQWDTLVTRVSDPNQLNQLAILSGAWNQNVGLFVRRIEEHLHEHIPGCQVIEVPLQAESSPATSGDRWGIHLNAALESRLGLREGPSSERLDAATRRGPLLIVLIALPNPVKPLSLLSAEQQAGLEAFLCETLPGCLAQTRRITVLVALEHRAESQSLRPWVTELAKRCWNATPRVHLLLDPLTLPTWEEVEDYLRRYPEGLPLDVLLSQVRALYEEVCQPGTTFEQLASAIDDLIQVHV